MESELVRLSPQLGLEAVTVERFVFGTDGFIVGVAGPYHLAYAQNLSRWRNAEVLDHLGPLEILL